jgi:hypothetical protein
MEIAAWLNTPLHTAAPRGATRSCSIPIPRPPKRGRLGDCRSNRVAGVGTSYQYRTHTARAPHRLRRHAGRSEGRPAAAPSDYYVGKPESKPVCITTTFAPPALMLRTRTVMIFSVRADPLTFGLAIIRMNVSTLYDL